MSGPQRRLVRKVVCYVVHDGRLLVFTHDDVPMEVTGVQVPAGSIGVTEAPDEAAIREVREETGLRFESVRALGVERYDMWPAKPEVHERYFFQFDLAEGPVPERWQAGEDDSSDGGAPVRWTCWWMALSNAHVLCAGFGARLGEVAFDDEHWQDPADPSW